MVQVKRTVVGGGGVVHVLDEAQELVQLGVGVRVVAIAVVRLVEQARQAPQSAGSEHQRLVQSRQGTCAFDDLEYLYSATTRVTCVGISIHPEGEPCGGGSCCCGRGVVLNDLPAGVVSVTTMLSPIKSSSSSWSSSRSWVLESPAVKDSWPEAGILGLNGGGGRGIHTHVPTQPLQGALDVTSPSLPFILPRPESSRTAKS